MAPIDPKKIWSSSQLPTLPTVAMDLLELSRDPDTQIDDVVAVIKTDPAITAKLLKATNSSMFGFRSEVTSLDRAIPLLGTTVVTSLALGFSLADSAMTSGPLAKHYNDYWMQSVVQAAVCELLAEKSGSVPNDFFLGGLLMGIGRLAMLKTIENEYLEVLERVESEQLPLLEVEREMLSFDHVEVGGKLLEHWQIPEMYSRSIRYQHASLEEILAYDHAPSHELVKALAVSMAIGEYFCASGKGPALQRMQELTSEFYGLKDASLDAFLETARARIHTAGETFSAHTKNLGDAAELMAQANEHLAALALRQHAVTQESVARQEAIEAEKRELESQNQALQEKALRDPLTKLHNRSFFGEALGCEIDRCQRTASHLGVLFCDIDKFKNLNDTYGHPFGDLVLKRVAELFVKVARKSDVVARYGGEEFVVLVGQASEKGVARLAERIRAAIEAELIEFEGTRVPVTISIGGVVSIPGRVEENLGDRLVATADEAMYDSKENGRNQVHMRSLIDREESALIARVTQHHFSRWLVRNQHFDIPTVSRTLLTCPPEHVQVGALAQRLEWMTQSQVDEVLETQRETNERFGRLAVRQQHLTEGQLVHLLALQQEDPKLLVRALIQSGLFEPDAAARALSEYNAGIEAEVGIAATVAS